MNQTTEGKRRNTEADGTGKWSVRKKLATLAVVIALVCVTIVPVFAWLYYERSMQTITKINEPNALVIGAGDAQAITQLELSDIDVSEGDHKDVSEGNHKDVVFCVYSNSPSNYNLQLAHTTNIGFTYTIYPASKDSSGGSDTVNYLDKDFYFDTDNPVPGSYLNQASDTSVAESAGDYHDKTYTKLDGSGVVYDKVQTNAEPLYWQTTEVRSLVPDDSNGNYINYYVLRISWDESIRNNKETDMVYLMAEAAGSDSE